MKAVLLIILGILLAGLIFGIVMLIKNIAELIYINRGRRSFEQFHAETEQMIYDYCMKNNMTRDQFFDKMSESLNNKDMTTPRYFKDRRKYTEQHDKFRALLAQGIDPVSAARMANSPDIPQVYEPKHL